MGFDGLGSDFDLFRQHGDVGALERVFDGAAPELLSLALHLTRGLDRAEDLVQATFLAAIEGARGYDSRRPLMPWLLGILVRQASKVRRAEGRSIDPGRMRYREAPDPSQESEASEVSEVIAGAVRALPPRYRDVLEAHLIDGKRAVAIAHELERAPGTVRMQILRGLELLRKSLPPGLATGVGLLALGSRGLADVRATVVQQAQLASPALAAAAFPSLSTTWLLGGVLVSVKTIGLSLAVLVLATGSWWALRRDPQAVAPEQQVASALETAELSTPPSRVEPMRTVPEPAGMRETAAVAVDAESEEALGQPAPGWWLVGNVTGVASDIVPSVSIRAWIPNLDDGSVSCELLADGSFELELTGLFDRDGFQPRELLISANQPRYRVATRTIRVGPEVVERDALERTEIPCEIEMLPGCVLEGHVRVPPGRQFNEVSVGLFALGPDGTPDGSPVRDASVGEDGSYRFDKREPGTYAVVGAGDGLVTKTHVVSAGPAAAIAVPLLDLGHGNVVLGGQLVLLPGISPQGCRIVARRIELAQLAEPMPRSDWNALRWTGESFESLEQTAIADEGGSFRVSGIPAGLYELSIEKVPAVMGVFDLEPMRARAPSGDVLLTGDMCRIVVDVHKSGVPTSALVSFVSNGNTYRTSTDSDGSVVVLGNATVDYKISALAGDLSEGSCELPAANRALETGCTIELVDPVEPALLVLRRRAADPEYGFVRVRLDPLSPQTGSGIEQKLSVANGAFRLKVDQPGAYRVTVEPGEEGIGPFFIGFLTCERFDVELFAGEEFSRTLSVRSGGRIGIAVEGVEGDPGARCRVVDAAGSARDVRFVSRTFVDNILSISSTTGGISVLKPCEIYPNLPPGTYGLELEVDGYQPIDRSVVVRAGETTQVRLKLVAE